MFGKNSFLRNSLFSHYKISVGISTGNYEAFDFFRTNVGEQELKIVPVTSIEEMKG